MAAIDLRHILPVRVPRFRGERWLVALGIFAALLTCFYLSGVFTLGYHTERGQPSDDVALFFSVVIAYIVPVFGYISERTRAMLQQVAPGLDASEALVEQWRTRVFTKPVGWLVTVLAIGCAGGLLHNYLLTPSSDQFLRELRHGPGAAVIAGTQLTWLVITLVVAALIDDARILGLAARRAHIEPFRTAHLRPFATIAVIYTLALVGVQAAFPIMSLNGGLDPMAYVPGLLATGGPMILIAALPVWPLHRRLAVARRRLLTDLDSRITALPRPDPDRPETLERLVPLLTYRREIAAASEWPFDVGVLSRLALYLIIPPLTWVGAALIEQVVDRFF